MIQKSRPHHLDPAQNPWLCSAGLLRIIKTLADAGGTTRVVGGAVRDALRNMPVGDIDLATTLNPIKVMQTLESAGIKVAPTGLAHGTIMAIIDGVPYEITTLRRDVETDGRHATVAFTDDWATDAARRDFTINALYADSDGTLYDYYGGCDDLAAGRVRFIGDAYARIDEDALRILRYFRFYGLVGRGDADPAATTACRDKANNISTLSVERVWREIIKILALPNPHPAWRLMVECNVIKHALPEATNLHRLEKLLDIEQRHAVPPTPMLRLVALMDNRIHAPTISARLKFANREATLFENLMATWPIIGEKLDPAPFRRTVYDHGTETCHHAVMIAAAEDPARDITQALNIAMNWEPPTFPIQGADIVRMGLPAGPRVGQILKIVEEWWKDADFRPTRDECLAQAKSRL